MFGFVSANWNELTKEQRDRYGAVYCGICRSIGQRISQPARLTLSYDMAFLALLHMSLYEPEEQAAPFRCLTHPLKQRSFTDNPYVRYAADLNVALAYYKALDDYADEGRLSAKLLAGALRDAYASVELRLPRQCAAIERGITRLRELEKANTPNPDEPAAVFGELMAELMVYEEDLWANQLRGLGFHLGRFIYLADAMMDYDRDERRGSYNPFLAMGQGKQEDRWEEYLLLAMGSCTECFEKLPLVQDKALLDNILYSGVWVQYRGKNREEDHHGSV